MHAGAKMRGALSHKSLVSAIGRRNVRTELWHYRVQQGEVSGWLPHEFFRSTPLLGQGVALARMLPSGALSGNHIVPAIIGRYQAGSALRFLVVEG